MTRAGFKINPGDHPIVPMMLGDAKVAVEMADAMLINRGKMRLDCLRHELTPNVARRSPLPQIMAKINYI